jgi:ribosomal protein S18 acetylase RimI-like enzyme
MLQLRRLNSSDTNLALIAAQLNEADSEVSVKNFSAESLQKFLSDPDNFYLVATIDDQLAGAVHGYKLLHPTGVAYLYIDEVDTVKNFRRQGVARMMVEESLKIAKELGCAEAWLGTEHDNEPAKALYEGFKPDEVDNGPIYTWHIQ